MLILSKIENKNDNDCSWCVGFLIFFSHFNITEKSELDSRLVSQSKIENIKKKYRDITVNHVKKKWEIAKLESLTTQEDHHFSLFCTGNPSTIEWIRSNSKFFVTILLGWYSVKIEFIQKKCVHKSLPLDPKSKQNLNGESCADTSYQ